jgi:hypothetical protein
MNHSFIINQLQYNKEVFHRIFSDINQDQQIWKLQPDKWCMLEVVCHLYDEEREDFRARAKHTMEHPELPLPKIDPVGWVTERKYMEQDFNLMLKNFLAEREKSIEWLQSLVDANWSNVHQHPKFGDMSAEYFLTNWLAHDYLHIRQITKLKYDYLHHITGINLSYAGDW